MAQATNYTEAAVLTGMVNGSAIQLSSEAPYIGLLTSAPSDSASGTEVNAASYNRVQVGGANQGTFDVNDGLAVNNAEFRWGDALTDWGNITHVALYDSAENGNMILYATLTSAVEILAGDIFKIPPSGFSISFD
jgi:hypothetical protein